jgi:hypothetical protein
MACHSGKGWSLRLRGERAGQRLEPSLTRREREAKAGAFAYAGEREAKARAFAYAGEREAKAGAFAYALLLNVALDNHFAALKLVV